MIVWLTGNSGSGKTTLANQLKDIYFPDWIILDGDEVRAVYDHDLGFEKFSRVKNNIRMARLADLLHRQKFNIIVSSIAPFQIGREIVDKIIDCEWIYLPGGKTGIEYPYEIPNCKKYQNLHLLALYIESKRKTK